MKCRKPLTHDHSFLMADMLLDSGDYGAYRRQWKSQLLDLNTLLVQLIVEQIDYENS